MIDNIKDSKWQRAALLCKQTHPITSALTCVTAQSIAKCCIIYSSLLTSTFIVQPTSLRCCFLQATIFKHFLMQHLNIIPMKYNNNSNNIQIFLIRSFDYFAKIGHLILLIFNILFTYDKIPPKRMLHTYERWSENCKIEILLKY